MIEWDLRKFRVLTELKRQGTVTATAQALSLTPSAVSQTLNSLSRQIGAPIVEPDGRRVRLTEVAHLLLRHGDAVFAQLEAAEAEIEAYLGGEEGLVRIGSFATGVEALVMPALDLLRQSRPTFQASVHEAEAAEVYTLLERGEIDVALSLAAHTDGAVAGGRLVSFPLLADPMDVALPAGHHLAGQAGLHLADLAEEAWVFGASGPWRDITLAACAEVGFAPIAAHTASDWGAILAIVQAGMGVALVPRLVDARRPGVRIRVLTEDQPRRHVIGAVRRGSETAPRLKVVVRSLQRVAEDRRRYNPSV
ncbi:LysR family transcriptional regulator [Streptacidiphilus fuscans]|uniref:LysR family transcriptional regulator n=1 Tax=Streptacidiphilus fuscans TaxID=2789292 RepID=A0A931B739_9ACTN|nr:LysR family transcriptional regulator [Streptacidiphilus fuscans]MBF9070216.1 LysR family transcriptional regulator [Streptacidiphilus fuscans]